jgi:hypothetical protein
MIAAKLWRAKPTRIDKSIRGVAGAAAFANWCTSDSSEQ